MPGTVYTHKVPISDLTSDIVCRVTISGYNGWLVRLWAAKAMIRLACWIAGVGLRVEE